MGIWDSIYGSKRSGFTNYHIYRSEWFPKDKWDTDSINLSSWGFNGDTIMIRLFLIDDMDTFFLDNV